MLAHIARTAEKLFHPTQHGTGGMQIDLLQIKLRDVLVRQRVNVILSVRFTLKSLGIKLRSPNTASFVLHARMPWNTGLRAGIAVFARSAH